MQKWGGNCTLPSLLAFEVGLPGPDPTTLLPLWSRNCKQVEGMGTPLASLKDGKPQELGPSSCACVGGERQSNSTAGGLQVGGVSLGGGLARGAKVGWRCNRAGRQSQWGEFFPRGVVSEGGRGWAGPSGLLGPQWAGWQAREMGKPLNVTSFSVFDSLKLFQ